MSKRMTDTDKWKKPWFRKLNQVDKCFWLYICDNCDFAGVWEVDFELAEFFIGCKLDISHIKAAFDKQFSEADHGKRWIIADFVGFQYGILKPDNRVHKAVLDKLERLGASKPLVSPLERAKEKEKDKDIKIQRENINIQYNNKNKNIPADLATCKAYFKELGYSGQADRFMDYFTSIGWKVGRNPMKDWKAAARNWCARVGGVPIKSIPAPETIPERPSVSPKDKKKIDKLTKDLANKLNANK